MTKSELTYQGIAEWSIGSTWITDYVTKNDQHNWYHCAKGDNRRW